MSDAEETPPPNDADRRAAAEPFLRLARLGAESWNRWIRTVVDDEQAKALGIETIEKFTDDELGQLAAKAEIKALPAIGKIDGKWQGVVFDDVDFMTIENPPVFSDFAFPKESSFARSRFGDFAHFDRVCFGDEADFRGAKFADHASFMGALFGTEADFRGAKFGESADFSGAIFGDTTIGTQAHFGGASFGEGASFEEAAFVSAARFEGASFGGAARFEGATFHAWAGFRGATFGYEGSFKGASFGHVAEFTDSSFDWTADFKFARFRSAHFEGATLGDFAEFESARFGHATFDGARFGGSTNFESASFEEEAVFSAHDATALRNRLKEVAEERSLNMEAAVAFIDEGLKSRPADSFHSLSFSGARFGDGADFTGRRFLGPLSLRNAVFHDVPELASTEGAGNIDPSGMQISFQGPIPIPVLSHARRALSWLAGVVLRRPIPEHHRHWTADSMVSARIRRLRKIMADIHAHDIERDLFILEKKADRGVLWELRGFRNRWKSIVWTLLLAVYGALSDCGRSLLRPIAWLGATWLSFQALYRHLMNGTRSFWDADLASFTLGNMLPFASGLNPARKDVLARLFSHLDPFLGWTIKVPISIELASIAQGTLGALLLFLLLLAIRNRFKIG